MAGTITRSPFRKSFTSAPVSTTSPTASCPKIMSWRSPSAPSHTVWMSEVHGAMAIGRTSASSGPMAGGAFSIHPAFPIPSIANPFICGSSFKMAMLCLFFPKRSRFIHGAPDKMGCQPKIGQPYCRFSRCERRVPGTTRSCFGVPERRIKRRKAAAMSFRVRFGIMHAVPGEADPPRCRAVPQFAGTG